MPIAQQGILCLGLYTFSCSFSSERDPLLLSTLYTTTLSQSLRFYLRLALSNYYLDTMKYFAAIAALVSVLPHIAAATIDTPNNVVQCQPTLLTYAGVAPFFISIIPGGQPSAAPLETLPRQDDESVTWFADIAAGTSITIEVKDATGATGYTDKIMVQNSDDRSCLKTGAGSPSSPASNTSGTTVEGTAKTPQAPAPTNSNSGANRPANVPPQQPPAAATTTVRPVGGIQAVSSSTSTPLTAPTVAASGAKSFFAFSGFGVAAVVTLFGALSL